LNASLEIKKTFEMAFLTIWGKLNAYFKVK
jgi:hypothetical protein